MAERSLNKLDGPTIVSATITAPKMKIINNLAGNEAMVINSANNTVKVTSAGNTAYTTAQLHNTVLSTSAASSPENYENGCLWIKYTA